MSQTNNNTEIKEQDTQDEIVFERKKHIPSFLLFWIIYTGFLCFFLYLFPRLFNKEIDYKWFIVFFMFLLIIYVFARAIYKMANIKRIYVTKEKLVIEYYIKNDLVFPLGTFFIYYRSLSYSLSPGHIVIHTFGDKAKEYLEHDIFNYGDDPKNNFFVRVNTIIKPHVMPYLLSLSDKEFEKIFFHVNATSEINTTFLKEAMELRKEKKDE
ncbi:hypothetical protein [Campylobacter jejuni]|uniref:hypothetical protein n=1 Tax=Campylobacter jejuni TaxID=197 RepID=UPI000F80A50A|nr:hypothetical protein [Campylobacter jejuni]RTJ50240.1 hypothetical protein C3H71_09035 [Campylobacter jejuni]RTJ86135.1 hypothetical protein C3H46_08880 [Campylobacter jejuni]HED4594474.1 hypothetical protein [Campylobacter jejuni]HED5415966.1 hypothetical protein [Campylobacter jejuni]